MIAGLFATMILGFQGELPTPPAMPRRAIAPRQDLPGTSLEIEDAGQKLTLFLPKGDGRPEKVALTVHFHSAIWHAIQEHIDRGLAGPLIAFYPGEGSSIYGKSFEDPDRLGRWITLAQEKMTEHGWPSGIQIGAVDVSSFSAGYGAVRQLVRQPANFARLRRVVLADSLYGSLAGSPGETGDRVPLAEHVEVWKPLAEAAIRGEKTFVITCSEVPTPTYASSSEMAVALVKLFGGDWEPAKPGRPADDLEFPLQARFDRGRFHVWRYGGQDGQAHMTHARHLADLWKALDRVGAP